MSVKTLVRSVAMATCLIGMLTRPPTVNAGVMTYPGLTAVRITEYSGGPLFHFFLPASPQMTNQLGTLNVVSNDFIGAPSEVFDVFYSDANGALNVNGNYVTVEARFNGLGGGGLNLAAVDLLLGASPFTVVRADVLASFVGLGTNYVAGSEVLAVDADGAIPSTFTTMGNTANSNSRLRVTVGWKGIQAPEPTSIAIASTALLLGCALRHRRPRV